MNYTVYYNEILKQHYVIRNNRQNSSVSITWISRYKDIRTQLQEACGGWRLESWLESDPGHRVLIDVGYKYGWFDMIEAQDKKRLGFSLLGKPIKLKKKTTSILKELLL